MKKFKLAILLVSLSIISCSNNKESTTMSENSSTSFSNIENVNEINDINYDVDLNALNNKEGLTPSKGNINILLVPIHFIDISDSKLNEEVLNEAFNSTESDKVEWLSVKEFYKQSSYNQCKLNFKLTPSFTPANHSNYYSDKYHNNYYYGAEEIIKEAITFLDETIDFTKYDMNNDGFVDGVYFIYDHPVDFSYNEPLWWAFTYYFDDNDFIIDGKKLKSYVFAGYDFLMQDDANGNKNNYNTHTYIHEMAHMFGIDDYYDLYLSSGTNVGGLAGGDIMDGTIGDHNSFSKALLGWSKGKYVTPLNSITLDLKPSVTNNEFIVLANDFNEDLGWLQEYFIIEYYKPTNINEYDKMFSTSGIRILHVVANTKKDGTLKYNNSTTNVKLISQITNSNGATYLNATIKRTDGTLFVKDERLNEVKYANGDKLNYSISVDEILDDKAIITINKCN